MKKWRRSRRYNRHHIRNKVNGGKDYPSNIIRLDTERHAAWHFLFGNKTFSQVAEMLLRAIALKQGYYNGGV